MWLKCRHLRALQPQQNIRALRKARNDELSDDLILDLVFPSAWDQADAPNDGAVAQGRIFPIPNNAEYLRDNQKKMELAIANAIATLSPDIKIEAIDFGGFSRLREASETVLQRWQRTQTFFGSPAVDGYFFAGAEARLNEAADGSVGRRAGKAAETFLRNRIT